MNFKKYFEKHSYVCCHCETRCTTKDKMLCRTYMEKYIKYLEKKLNELNLIFKQDNFTIKQ